MFGEYSNAKVNMNSGLSKWKVLVRSVKGASHDRSNKPNQDAFKRYPGEDGNRWAASTRNIVAVADGHGSTRHFRSHYGAKFAVESCVDVLKEFLDNSTIDINVLKEHLDGPAAKEIVEQWLRRVRDHLNDSPPGEDETACLGEVTSTVTEVAYGATLLAAITTERFLYFIQIGDGDMLLLDEDGQVRAAVEEDANLFANETYSLCMKDAWKYTRRRCIALSESVPPRLITISTDGLCNCFANRSDFESVPIELLDEIDGEGGMEKLERELDGILADWSRRGSGDDMTLAILNRELNPPGKNAAINEIAQQTIRLEQQAGRAEKEATEAAQRASDAGLKADRAEAAAVAAGQHVGLAIEMSNQVAVDLEGFRTQTEKRFQESGNTSDLLRQNLSKLEGDVSKLRENSDQAMDMGKQTLSLATENLSATEALRPTLDNVTESVQTVKDIQHETSKLLRERFDRCESALEHGQKTTVAMLNQLQKRFTWLVIAIALFGAALFVLALSMKPR